MTFLNLINIKNTTVLDKSFPVLFFDVDLSPLSAHDFCNVNSDFFLHAHIRRALFLLLSFINLLTFDLKSCIV
jgi:hypothetical protein